ncbi:hypothetical protein [Pseudomonas syringae group sp. J248-6]|uniref:hypothetical protein n=1 Tax=Pseudomonas syringae group sp. J248-6 TaxID=3079590 RepID=UPI0029133624|nr:hypothetical protein [Pseudomonas syringae group sp. J248-6]MDU8543630.1 hypothetical protein [Pseudomonas syringae group sp. J248-6]
MKALILVSALVLFGSGLAAAVDRKLVEFTVEDESQNTTVLIPEGRPTPFGNFGGNMRSFGCAFESSTADTQFSVDLSSGIYTIILPFESDERGVTAYVSITKRSAIIEKTADVSGSCKLPIGVNTSTGATYLGQFPWNTAVPVKFADGSVVNLTANQPVEIKKK